jgi:hypothetical protein
LICGIVNLSFCIALRSVFLNRLIEKVDLMKKIPFVKDLAIWNFTETMFTSNTVMVSLFSTLLIVLQFIVFKKDRLQSHNNYLLNDKSNSSQLDGQAASSNSLNYSHHKVLSILGGAMVAIGID